MAVITTQSGGGGGFFGGLGGLLSLGSMLIPGAPAWMAPTGMGLSAVNSMARGDPSGMLGVAAGIKGAGGFGNWLNPGQGNLYTPGGQEIENLWGPAAMAALRGKDPSYGRW